MRNQHAKFVSRGCRTLLILIGLAIPSDLCGQGFNRIVAFGDSLSDTGNAASLSFGLIPDPALYFAGRFSNGPVWLETFAQASGIPVPQPFFRGGSNFAIGGAEADAEPGWGIQIQVLLYLLFEPPPTSSDLFVLWAGANDLLNGEMSPEQVAYDVASNLVVLSNAGATAFVVPNLPALGETPGSIGSSQQQVLNSRTATYNASLAAMLNQIESLRPDLLIVRVDADSLFTYAKSFPASLGLTNTTNSALNPETGEVVSSPNSYLFWDDIHPTWAAHWVIGQFAASQLSAAFQ